MIIVLFNTGSSRTAFFIYSFGKLVLVVFLCFLCFLLVLCFEFNATIWIIIIYLSVTCSVIFYHFNVCKNIKKSFSKKKQETLCASTIAMICSTLALLSKFQYFQRPMYNPVEHLWLSFYCKNSNLLSIF